MLPTFNVSRHDEKLIATCGEVRWLHRQLPHKIAAVEVLVLCLERSGMWGHVLHVSARHSRRYRRGSNRLGGLLTTRLICERGGMCQRSVDLPAGLAVVV
ncbi:hypothetical protein K2224_37690 (plasmid) [Streptomyces sp. BHT-5-2]|uniref:hypothetical protein n=1 Tax=unclassified Streptomyces TaxID=2593676 RepID=UPI001C8D8031|nr:hypothetical protein [Streptomyces sp. BHT-5-2]QZL08771.1 hypothetical protein K2224_37690 [Streptomyces sp. BHT-5-2]